MHEMNLKYKDTERQSKWREDIPRKRKPVWLY